MDQIIVAPAVHAAVGGLTLLLALLTAGLGLYGARRGEFGRAQAASLIALQLALLLQAAIGIKLLDQGMGALQKYVHYLGGLGAIGLVTLFYWLPRRTPAQTARNAAWLGTAALTFVALSFFVGQFYVRQQLGA